MKRVARPLLALAVAAAILWASGSARVRGAPPQDDGPSVTLRMIVVTSADAAQRILDRLHAGESFILVAKAESTAPSADDGGWLGRLPLSQLRPEVRQALTGVSPGHVTGIVRIPTGFAIFRVEPDEPGVAAGAVGGALASSGAVRYVYDVSGFSEARAALESLDKPADWNMHPRSICDARTKSLANTQASIEAYLAPSNQAARARQTPINLMQLVFGLGQLDAYQGQMAQAIARFEEAARIAAADVPTAVLQMEEALGIAHLHKSSMDNHVFSTPGDYCLLPFRAGKAYPDPSESEKAIAAFQAYLAQKPNDLEVRWLLNLAYMTTGGYPDKVPAALLIPPSAFESTEDVGRFHDVAPQAGLANFAMAGGLVVDDLRNTGRFDVLTSTMDSCGTMRFFANNGDGTFTDRTAEAGLSDELGGLNIVPADYDNDGCQDVLVLRGGWEYLPQRRSLLKNSCHGTFTDVTVASGLGAAATTTQTAAWADIDNDGFLDVFIGNETGPAQLFRNKGDGTFEDISQAAGVSRSSFSKGVTAIDYDNDRYPDFYVSNYGETNFLYHNNRNGTFTEFSTAARVTGTPTGFATWFFDYDNDGWPDLFVTSYVASVDEMVRDYLHMPHNATTTKLYRNQGDGTFRDVSAAVGLNKVMMPMGSNFGDIDNDGYLDLYLGTGQPSYAATSGSVLLRNDAGKAFVDVTASSGTGELHKGHGVAFADLDNDGDEDLVFEVGGATPGDRHAMRLFENPGHPNDWIALKLVGVKSNRGAVGARIKATVTNASGQTRSIYRTVGTGGSFGASPLMQHIGLGPAADRVDLEIWWPTTDTRQRFANVGKDEWLQIEEFAEHPTRLRRDPVRLGGGRRVDP
jgi:tetratricopeptide (TPR) repeat protein